MPPKNLKEKTPKNSAKPKGSVPKLAIQVDDFPEDNRPETTSTPRSPIAGASVSVAEFNEFKRLLEQKEAENARLHRDLAEARSAVKKKKIYPSPVVSAPANTFDTASASSNGTNYMLSPDFGESEEEEGFEDSISQLRSAVKSRKAGDGILRDSSSFSVSEAAVFA